MGREIRQSVQFVMTIMTMTMTITTMLCYGCLGNMSKEHNAKSCANRMMCEIWSRRHPTVLHGLKIKKYKKKGKNEGTDTKENKPEEVRCASTNTRSDVISMCIVPAQVKSKDTKGYSCLCTSE